MDLVELAGGQPSHVSAPDQIAPLAPRRFELTVEGEPVPKLQGDIVFIKGKGGTKGHGTIKPNRKTQQYEDIVRQRATFAWGGQPLIMDTAIDMRVTFFRNIPASWSKRDRARAIAGEWRPITKPDNDNYVKAFKDGLKGVVFYDDALVVTTHIEKWYSERPRVEVALIWGEPQR